MWTDWNCSCFKFYTWNHDGGYYDNVVCMISFSLRFRLVFFCLCLCKTILQPLIRYESMAFIIFPPFIHKVIMYSIFSRHYVFIEMLNCVMDPDVCHKRAGTWKPRSTSFISVFTSICLVIDTTSFAYKRPS